ncbi:MULTISPECIES: hypothetical protein [Streptomyces]|uniref:Uncharacterized protein n=1 Tax=Streptomyces rhizosphaericola TaxID=2564098 RepID=A0ABY2PHX0_9ACTN|nr:hypothetical protein [Streptomyces sp. S8]MYT97257.1 hypothetical protein [Streptomyces sp. SID8350]NGO85949.1 hypothetical protein [Streptomyces sp. 196(2019)]TGZ10671.1 hypothetical protein E5Z02_08705 [Streptomyces rhizosphaericola]SCK60477.1 hypothetical protein YUWDRAFT_05821 [Streptomyces sp. AmelKG-D3]ARI53252.1 hypothetical protein A6E92_14355 [Streptomyces sp. S8]
MVTLSAPNAQDYVALAEIELCGELMIAASAAREERLSPDRIDEVLNVRDELHGGDELYAGDELHGGGEFPVRGELFDGGVGGGAEARTTVPRQGARRH